MDCNIETTNPLCTEDYFGILPPWAKKGDIIKKEIPSLYEENGVSYNSCMFIHISYRLSDIRKTKERSCTCRITQRLWCEICGRYTYYTQRCQQENYNAHERSCITYESQDVLVMDITHTSFGPSFEIKGDDIYGWMLEKDMNPEEITWSKIVHNQFGYFTRTSINTLLMIWMRNGNLISRLPKDILFFLFTFIKYI
jgi:hypothetical protein